MSFWPFSQDITIVLEFGNTLKDNTGLSIDFINIYPFFLSGSISSNRVGFNKVILASRSTTIKSGHSNGFSSSSLFSRI